MFKEILKISSIYIEEQIVLKQKQTSVHKGPMLFVTVCKKRPETQWHRTFIMPVNSVGQESEQSREESFLSIPLSVSCGSWRTGDWKHLEALLTHMSWL